MPSARSMIPGRSSGSLKDLSDRPDIERLEQYLTRIVGEHGVRLEFIVLFGSMARWRLVSRE
jgi:predicted nucleotidyltransferase